MSSAQSRSVLRGLSAKPLQAAIGGLLTLLVMRTEKSAGTVRQEQTERAEPGEQVGV